MRKLRMPQMKAPNAGSIHMLYGELESGFFRLQGDQEGRLYFAGLHGRWVYSFPVLENGEINRWSDWDPYPHQGIVVLDGEDLAKIGIHEMRWSNEDE